MKKGVWLLCLALAVENVDAQKIVPDSLGTSAVNTKHAADSLGRLEKGPRPDTLIQKKTAKKFIPNPRTAVLLSIVPGAGQAYNRDYWKMPFVIAAFIGVGYDIQWQTRRYRDYKGSYLEFFDSNGNRIAGMTTNSVVIRPGFLDFKGKTEIKQGQFDQIKRGKDFYRRWRDYGYVFLGAAYALSAIEAYVAAHMKSFDISEDLSMKVHPAFFQSGSQFGGVTSSPGVRMVFSFR